MKRIKYPALIAVIGYLLVLTVPVNTFAQTGAINVKTMGAKADGTTDDTQAIKKAFAAVLQNGGTVYFPEGNYLTNIIDIRPQKGVSILVIGDQGKTNIKKNPADPMNVALFFCEIADVKISFKNLNLDGSASSKVGKWKSTGKDIDVDAGTNGIYAYNVASLTVTDCKISNFHGKGIACYSAGSLIANNNVISDVSGSGITGHRVNSMETIHNSISNTGFLADNYILDGKQYSKSSHYPAIKFGDGIESESNQFVAKENTIVNSGRCGIVHDLAQNLGYKNSHALVSFNNIEINSDNINNNNPPAGMWFEQSGDVEVTNNKVTLKRSYSTLVSGIRFYDVTNSIICLNNIIDATGYNHISNGGIGIYEPAGAKVDLEKNTISGNFTASVDISYGNNISKVDNLNITGNQFSGGDSAKANMGIQISIDGKRQFPTMSNITDNKMANGIKKPYSFRYYGSQPTGSSSNAVVNIKNNTITDGDKHPVSNLAGVKINQ